jgi:hypothetical protein
VRQQTVTVKFFESKVHRSFFTEKLEKNYWEEWIVPLQVPSATVATAAPVCVGFSLVGRRRRRRRRRRLLQVAPTRRPMLRGGGGGASDDAEARARADRLSAELRDRMRVRFTDGYPQKTAVQCIVGRCVCLERGRRCTDSHTQTPQVILQKVDEKKDHLPQVRPGGGGGGAQNGRPAQLTKALARSLS